MAYNLELGVLFCIIILIIYILASILIETYKIRFIHESGLAIASGALASLLLYSVIQLF